MGSYGELVSYSSGCVLLVLTALLSAKLVPVAYGIKKLQIACVVEDDKVNFTWRSILLHACVNWIYKIPLFILQVGTDFLEESITVHEDLVQSVDIVAFNKV